MTGRVQRSSHRGQFQRQSHADQEEAKLLMNDSFHSDHGSEHDVGDGVQVGRIVGTCHNNDLLRLKRLLFRSTRGNALVVTKDDGGIETFEHKKLPRSVFIIIFQEGKQLRSKIETIAQNFSKNKFRLPKADFKSKLSKLNERIEQARQLIVMTVVGIQKYLESCNIDCKLDLFRRISLHEQAIYTKLDYMYTNDTLFQGYFWSCKTHQEIEVALQNNDINIPESQIVNGHIGSIPPPTYFPLNEFTGPFQEIVSTYGVPKYKEVNPAYFSIVTFPFLFGVMFGDIGHGGFFFTIGIILCMWKNTLERYEPMKMALQIRYLILMMGFFSLFCGLMYNDFMSVPMQFHATT